jgi:methionyl-tRNA formyltransferase
LSRRDHYLFASRTDAPVTEFERRRDRLPGEWTVVRTPEALAEAAAAIDPAAIFLPHWSHIVPESILARCPCVCFHMTDLPYGRGGSPLQNLILRGHEETMLTALKMTGEVDAGPVYLKRPLSLAGRAEKIYARAAALSLDMIEAMLADWPETVEQKGEAVRFKRLTEADNRLSGDLTARELADRIRMVDAPGYPNAYVDHGHWRLRFTQAEVKGETVTANVRWEARPDEV